MDLVRRALETMAWCAPRVQTNDVASCLRSTELRPGRDIAFWYGDPPLADELEFLSDPWQPLPDEPPVVRVPSELRGETIPRTYKVYLAETGGLVPWAEWNASALWPNMERALRNFRSAATVAHRRRTVEGMAIRRSQLLRERGWKPDDTLRNLP
ncbi:Hypothetical protein Deide_3p00901 (plasmid) [Deinococcus deserti VCD115]|uniref:Uncharacterized protein n=1 Tax=Deinococcus deserti (strain DSM 17065 / CIP 109153 / LMG 22923 / VCD115) TaxID=546414 RepID=C1D3F3_DEIDV|nr:Hypothetical protein Deide_3p00901 [Deinococcus deserti VCD115]